MVADGQTLEARDLVGHRLAAADGTSPRVLGQLGAALDAVAVLQAVVAVPVDLLAGAFAQSPSVGSLGVRTVVSIVSLQKNTTKMLVQYISAIWITTDESGRNYF